MSAQAFSGKPVSQIDLNALRDGGLVADDVRISAETLERQAQVAQAHGNAQLAENFRRAAELTAVPESEVLGLYEALRPGRSSAERLREIADDLETRSAPRCASLFREAAEVYHRRGLSG